MKMTVNPKNLTFGIEGLSVMEISNIGAALSAAGSYDNYSRVMAKDFNSNLTSLLDTAKPKASECEGCEVRL